MFSPTFSRTHLTGTDLTGAEHADTAGTMSAAGPRRSLVAAVAAVVALLACMLTVASPASASIGSHRRTSAEKAMGRAVFRAINSERHAHHLPALVSNSDLMTSARRHDVTMARFNTMSHQLPGEAFFAKRISSAGYKWDWAGENIAYNKLISTAGVLQLESMMYHEKAPNDGHRLNILSPHFHNVGVDIFIDHVHHTVWLTTDFGHHQ